MTPSLNYCTQQCLFCWRAQSSDLKAHRDETKFATSDSPENIANESIKAQLKILSGYKGNPNVNEREVQGGHDAEARGNQPHREATLYPQISELIQAYHKKGFTTFLVINGTNPSTLTTIKEEPTQLYVSVCAPDEATFKRVCRPRTQKA